MMRLKIRDGYGVGILGNCCTHGAGVAQQFRAHPKTRLHAGYEKNPRRARELAECLGIPLANSYREVVSNPGVHILAITTDPCDKAEMVEMAAEAGKPVLLNKPLCHTPAAARRIVNAARRSGIPIVFDIPMVKFLPAFDKLMRAVRAGDHGTVVSYYHSFGMTFPEGFPIRDLWPERFDPPAISGGGEMTNMGCYAIDYALTLLGMPRSVEARWQKFWTPYSESDVENFGQILLDYGRFWAVLAVGKQVVHGQRGHRNALLIEFENLNLFLDPAAGVLLENGRQRPLEEYLCGHTCVSSIDQLIRCMETGHPPESDVETGAKGVEVLAAAYQSILQGCPVSLSATSG
ncbi:MAG: Gfo/Idh/MocA family oxidoreductase [Planctomycetes bacterium]|nr:Gfo/Idh/MocA family oxidoreductase [Planctomycetota bacterium]